jgi:hypothetical protein
MDARTFATKVVNRLKRLYRDATRRMRQGHELFLDWRHGTVTAGVTPLELLSIASPNRPRGTYYEPIPMALFDLAMERLDLRPEDHVFVDLGSGKGRALMAASHYPFRELIGVEFASDLNQIAKSNLTKYRSRRRRNSPWRVEQGDAAEFEFPDEHVLLFLFNPFDGSIMRSVLANIETWLSDRGKSITIVYCNAKHADVFDAYPQLAQQEKIATPRLFGHPPDYSPHGLRIYRSRGSARDAGGP